MRNRIEVNHGAEASRADRSPSRQSGFTIIEMVISLAIFTIVVGAIYGLLEVARAGRLNTTNRAEVLQNVRVGLNAVGRDAINAGVGYPNLGAMVPDDRTALVGAAADGDNNPDFLTPVYAANNLNSVNGVLTDQVTFLFVDDTFNGGASIPVSAISDQGVSPTTLTIQPGFNNTPFSVGDLYLVTGQNGAALGVLTAKSGSNTLTFANTDPLNLNNAGAGAALNRVTPPASVLKVTAVTYHVADEDGNGTGTGTLKRFVYGGFNITAGIPIAGVDQPLAFGIENMQIQYVLADGTVMDSPSAIQMEDIRQIRIAITVRSPDADPKNIDPATHQPRPFRSTVTASFSTRNLVYEKL
ncbi:MAG TPA: prepilin-type N-terminal cleavage/methylation domain-containing protein [Blastocatellia bacterium]|nr:prepilin-type N-terminal cleavage/methylation domain-containing protein [Blastocatellia bacterium]